MIWYTKKKKDKEKKLFPNEFNNTKNNYLQEDSGIPSSQYNPKEKNYEELNLENEGAAHDFDWKQQPRSQIIKKSTNQPRLWF